MVKEEILKSIRDGQPKILVILENIRQVNILGGELLSELRKTNYEYRYKIQEFIEVQGTMILFKHVQQPLEAFQGLGRGWGIFTEFELEDDYPEIAEVLR